MANPPETALLTKVLKSPRNGVGRVLLAPTNRQVGGSSFSSSPTEVAWSPLSDACRLIRPQAVPQERAVRTERVRIPLNWEAWLEKDICAGHLESVDRRSYAD